jgi:hypothetical protein
METAICRRNAYIGLDFGAPSILAMAADADRALPWELVDVATILIIFGKQFDWPEK